MGDDLQEACDGEEAYDVQGDAYDVQEEGEGEASHSFVSMDLLVVRSYRRVALLEYYLADSYPFRFLYLLGDSDNFVFA